MKRLKFTAQELYLLAVAAKKEKMYGIPDGFEWVPDEEIAPLRQQICDSLLDEGVLTMDFDGNLFVTDDYAGLVSIYCDCGRCLTVNRQDPDGSSEDLIYWQLGDKLYCAEIMEDYYVFREVDSLTVEAELTKEEWSKSGAQESAEIVIPQIALTKAKRYAMNGDTEEALRILLQNGADDRTAAVLLDGLQEKARYLGLLLMDMSTGTCEQTEKVWLNSRGILFAMGTTVVNFRTCTVFREVEKEAIAAETKALTEAFLRRE